MPEARVANKYALQDDHVNMSLSTDLSGAPIASVSLDGRECSDIEVADHPTHWQLSCVTESVADLRTTEAHVRIPVVNLTSNEPEPVAALFSIITSHTSIAGVGGVSGPLETYQTRLVEGEASEIQTQG